MRRCGGGGDRRVVGGSRRWESASVKNEKTQECVWGSSPMAIIIVPLTDTVQIEC